MLSYPIDEAETLLSSKLSTAKTSLSNCEEDLDFLREQITVSLKAFATRVTATDHAVDNGGRYSKSLQLGGCAEAKGQGRGGGREEEREVPRRIIQKKRSFWYLMCP